MTSSKFKRVRIHTKRQIQQQYCVTKMQNHHNDSHEFRLRKPTSNLIFKQKTRAALN